ncbi:cation-translocating P-type ATPase [Thermosynechococcus sp. HN-54]|uniref:cation-translocating P-type ATPase n=1 Tax=Thermosynechococcus sp. HN-54 TaxID=2933959 RepID=UPI00202CAAE8|nr:cation-translocating P-type ATPase [Thermosynechococcus sp. HN-54]URR35288.1 cation-translocating P-type ATPase [Thermosynechococcus sp. HN-54]
MTPANIEPEFLWHALSADEVIDRLGSDRQQGLSLTDVQRRQATYGRNELIDNGRRPRWQIFIDQFRNVMLIMLLVVAFVSGTLDILEAIGENSVPFPKDAIAILLVVILNAILGYVQEARAEEALAALKSMAAPKVRVLREGKVMEIDSPELVVGDIFFLEAGVKVAADGRLLEAVNLQIREAALTGEAEAASKNAEKILPNDTEVGDRVNLVFAGTEVNQGRGVAVVTAIGMDTELGKIAVALQGVEQEPTPLQKRMTELGNHLVAIALVLVGIVVIAGGLYDPSLLGHLIEVALSMAVAVVPEGLPAVITVTLALGTQRMVKRHALIRRLPAVETLGSVTTICSDKTGTLTQNKMVVQAVATTSYQAKVSGTGYEPRGEFYDANTNDPSALYERQLLLLAGALCNDALLKQHAAEWVILGDPTEGSLLPLAAKGGIDLKALQEKAERVAEFPFDADRKRMSTFYRSESIPDIPLREPYWMVTKGSPELTLECCQWRQVGQEIQPLTLEDRQAILAANDRFAAQGLRVLGIAHRYWSELPPAESVDTSERELIWLGLVGILDPPRPEVLEAVATCRTAGIRPIMITGDHQLTAQAIASQIGICQWGDRALTGQDIEKLSREELDAATLTVNVYARVSPEHKLRIVKSLQRHGEIVAMTGDGVNDAPALKQADIGVAMGITGTDVTKEASDMVLLDDNFATIVAATEEGRVIYSNIRRFIKYILGSNIGEVITIACSPLLGLGGVPLTPLQILWMNLVTDGLPALALAVEPGDPDVMKRPPIQPNESIFGRGLGSYMIRVGLILAMTGIALMVWAYGYTAEHLEEGLDPRRWTTMVFTTLCLAQMGHALAARSSSRLTIEMNLSSNLYVWGSVILTTILQLLLIYAAPLRRFFGTYLLSSTELAVCIGFSTLVFVWVELEKLVLRLFNKGQELKLLE